MNLGDLFDGLDGHLGNFISLSEIALNLNEDGLHLTPRFIRM
jgi:hypothetical protein